MNNIWTLWAGILCVKHVILFFKEKAILYHTVWENNDRLIAPMCYPWRWLWGNYGWWLRKGLRWILFAVLLLWSFHWTDTASMFRGIREGRHALSFHLAQVELSYFFSVDCNTHRHESISRVFSACTFEMLCFHMAPKLASLCLNKTRLLLQYFMWKINNGTLWNNISQSVNRAKNNILPSLPTFSKAIDILRSSWS